MRRPLALQKVDVEFPVQPELHLQPQRRGRRLAPGHRGTAHEHRAVAGLGADLQAAHLRRANLRKPADEQPGGVGPDDLLSNPEPFGRALALDPHQMALVDAQVPKAGQVRAAGRSDDNEALAPGHDLAHGCADEAPLENARLELQQFGQ